MPEQETAVLSGNNPIAKPVDLNRDVKVKGLGNVYFERQYRTYWNRYGESAQMPADPAQAIIFIEQGWTLEKPSNPEPKPTSQTMADGSEFDLSGTANSLSDVERARLNGASGVITTQATPTATYYSQNGDVLEGLPADPESMKAYLELGLSLSPPKVEATT